MKRFYCKDLSNKTILSGDEHIHLSKVLRKKIGEEVILFDGESEYDYIFLIEKITKDKTILNLKSKILNERETINKYVLYQALIKGLKKDLIVQKAVELGISEIFFFRSKRTVCDINLRRLQKISYEASKQCGRSKIVKINYLDNLKLINFENYEQVIFFYEKAKQNIENVLKKNKKTNAIIIGPEGGFDENELNLFKGIESVSLGNRILRSETACIVGISLTMFLNGEFNIK